MDMIKGGGGKGHKRMVFVGIWASPGDCNCSAPTLLPEFGNRQHWAQSVPVKDFPFSSERELQSVVS